MQVRRSAQFLLQTVCRRHLPNLNRHRNHQKTVVRCAASGGQSSGDEKPSATALSQVGNAGADKAEQISQAMKAYLERARTQDAFMQSEVSEYEIGKRHLANIMGVDVDSFTQEHIDKAIEYLLPSGLYDKKARPHMKHPSEVIPKKNVAQFGMDGRPFHPFFYTGYPNYYQLMHDVAFKTEQLKALEDKIASRGTFASKEKQMILFGSKWKDKHAVQSNLQETITDYQYESFVKIMERLAHHPLSEREKEFIMSYRIHLATKSMIQDIPALLHDERGRAYMEATGERNTARAKVKVWVKGTGEVSINGKDLLGYLPCILDREQVMFPLQLMEKLDEVDLEVTVEGGGSSGQAGAIRLGISRALCSFVSEEQVEQMRLAGLLTRDPRVKERKKPGQAAARKKFTWKKR